MSTILQHNDLFLFQSIRFGSSLGGLEVLQKNLVTLCVIGTSIMLEHKFSRHSVLLNTMHAMKKVMTRKWSLEMQSVVLLENKNGQKKIP